MNSLPRGKRILVMGVDVAVAQAAAGQPGRTHSFAKAMRFSRQHAVHPSHVGTVEFGGVCDTHEIRGIE
jgi:hypothetical protein